MSWLLAALTHPATLVGLGGATGSNARFWLGRWVREMTGPTDFPWATMLINISGSLALGAMAGVFRDRTSTWYLLLGTGFCGGYTTFSTFSLEVAEALRHGRWGVAMMYVTASVAGGMAGFLLTFLFVGKPE